MSRPSSIPNISKNIYRSSFDAHLVGREMASFPQGLTALTIEFVAKPEEAHNAHSAVPSAIVGAMREVAGFSGCYILVSSYEPRLITVVTLWRGEDRMRRCAENVRWVQALLAPSVDRYLRVQTMAAYMPQAQSPEQLENDASEDELVPVAPEQYADCAA